MRYVPTPEQIAYLQKIGVPGFGNCTPRTGRAGAISSNRRASIRRTAVAFSAPARPHRRNPKPHFVGAPWLLIILLLILAVILVTCSAGQAQADHPDPRLSIGSNGAHELLVSQRNIINASIDRGSRQVLINEYADPSRRAVPSAGPFIVNQHRTNAFADDALGRTNYEMAEARIHAADAYVLSEKLQQFQCLILFSGCGLATIVAYVLWRFERRMRSFARRFSASLPVPSARSGTELRSGTAASAKILDPNELLHRVIKAAQHSRRIKIVPTSAGPRPWNIGLASVTGEVRERNEDYGVAFEIAGHQIIVVADGMGGLPFGREASYAAVRAAVLSIVRDLGTLRFWRRPRLAMIAEAAVRAAERWLTGMANRVTSDLTGFRTTLIVVCASRRSYGYSYIGDGGGCVLRASGELKHFLIPQKAPADAPNVLLASLGPTTEGEPIMGEIPRLPGDLLICGSDGVFDRVSADFPKRLMEAAIHFEGHLQRVATQVVDEMAAARDQAGFICDDNLTLGILGDGSRPELTKSFWSSPDDSQLESKFSGEPALLIENHNESVSDET
jgi:PPM family protein phosphatase